MCKFRKKSMTLHFLIYAIATIIGISPVTSRAADEAVSQLGGTVVSLGVMYAVMNTDMAEKFNAKCAASGNEMFCQIASITVMQAIITLATAKGAEKTKKDVEDDGGGGGDWPDDSSPNVFGPYKDEKGLENAINTQLTVLKRKGYSLDSQKGTLTDPSGKTHKISSLTSGAAMAAEGLISPADIALADKAIADLKDKYKVISMGIASGGGGYAGSTRSSSYTYADPYANGLQGDKVRAPVTSGLTRTLASGESIGSQTDNIFEMIRRRYQQKTEERIFVSP